MQKPFQAPQASQDEQETPEELRNSEIAMLVLLALMGAVALWMFLNPASVAEESSRSSFGEDSGHVIEFSDPDAMTPEQSVAAAHERRRLENLHAEPPPELDFRPNYVEQYSPEAREGIRHIEETGMHELFEGGKAPNLHEIDMSQYMPTQVREAGAVPMREATRAAEERLRETRTHHR